MTELRRIAEKKPDIKLAVKDSLSSVKVLLSSIFMHLKWKGKRVCIFNSAASEEISNFCSAILAIDSTLTVDGRYVQGNMTLHPDICSILSHCCKIEHYTFSILKCGEGVYKLCKPIRFPIDVFKSLNHIPLPTPENDHNVPFSDALKISTSGKNRVLCIMYVT